MKLFWLTQAVAYWSLVILLVPVKYIKKIFLFAFLGGFVYTWIVQLIAVDVFRLWYYKPDILTLWGIPVFFVFSWFAVTLVYGYFLLQYPRHQLWILIFFVLWTTAINYFADKTKIIFMPNWSVFETFMFAVFSHVFLLFVFKKMLNINELGTKEDIIEFTLSILKNKK